MQIKVKINGREIGKQQRKLTKSEIYFHWKIIKLMNS